MLFVVTKDKFLPVNPDVKSKNLVIFDDKESYERWLENARYSGSEMEVIEIWDTEKDNVVSHSTKIGYDILVGDK